MSTATAPDALRDHLAATYAARPIIPGPSETLFAEWMVSQAKSSRRRQVRARKIRTAVRALALIVAGVSVPLSVWAAIWLVWALYKG